VPFHFDKNAGLLAVKDIKTGADFELEEPPLIETLDEVRPALGQHFEARDWRGTGLARAATEAHHLFQDNKGCFEIVNSRMLLVGVGYWAW
jgi:hypothetical protein